MLGRRIKTNTPRAMFSEVLSMPQAGQMDWQTSEGYKVLMKGSEDWCENKLIRNSETCAQG